MGPGIGWGLINLIGEDTRRLQYNPQHNFFIFAWSILCTVHTFIIMSFPNICEILLTLNRVHRIQIIRGSARLNAYPFFFVNGTKRVTHLVIY